MAMYCTDIKYPHIPISVCRITIFLQINAHSQMLTQSHLLLQHPSPSTAHLHQFGQHYGLARHSASSLCLLLISRPRCGGLPVGRGAAGWALEALLRLQNCTALLWLCGTPQRGVQMTSTLCFMLSSNIFSPDSSAETIDAFHHGRF